MFAPATAEDILSLITPSHAQLQATSAAQKEDFILQLVPRKMWSTLAAYIFSSFVHKIPARNNRNVLAREKYFKHFKENKNHNINTTKENR